MTVNIEFNDLFENVVTFPDFEARERLDRLVGIDNYKITLAKFIGIRINSSSIDEWFIRHHPNALELKNSIINRSQLIILAGDVGTGKTELAETIGDMVARTENVEIELHAMSLSARGKGCVGEMTQLISAAFKYTISSAQKLISANTSKSRGGIILLIDEADALAQSREESQMHHEDRAGVNALIRGVDNIRNQKLPVAILMCTNRLKALDPAIKRRAAEILYFNRPNDMQRKKLLSKFLTQLNFDETHIDEIVKITGVVSERSYGFTYSDLTQKLLPSMVMSAYPNGPVDPNISVDIARNTMPTPPFKDNES